MVVGGVEYSVVIVVAVVGGVDGVLVTVAVIVCTVETRIAVEAVGDDDGTDVERRTLAAVAFASGTVDRLANPV